MKNKYIYHAKISEEKFRQLLKFFFLDLTAAQTTELTGLNHNTVDRLYLAIRQRLIEYSCKTSPIKGVFEANESYFGPKRVKGRRGRGAGNKTIVFNLYKRNGKAYTEIAPNAAAVTSQEIIRGHADIQSVIHTDRWRGYDGLVDLGYEKHFRVNHGNNEFALSNGNHINGIEGFGGFAKHRLSKFKGIPNDKFMLHLKETEFRFNNRGNNIYKILLKMLRENPLI
ncbi:MAG: IS1595 family transposase [Chloroflexi bacterium]|nr:IS1595 family transposase [Chloroflexota bacterium]